MAVDITHNEANGGCKDKEVGPQTSSLGRSRTLDAGNTAGESMAVDITQDEANGGKRDKKSRPQKSSQRMSRNLDAANTAGKGITVDITHNEANGEGRDIIPWNSSQQMFLSASYS